MAHKHQSFEAVFINLAKRQDRRRDMERSIRRVGFAASRFEAFTGDNTPVQVVQLTWDSTLNSQFDARQRPHPAVRMTAGERGCCMSHAVLWHQLASRDDGSAPLLVLEDDVVFEKGFLAGCA